MNFRKQISTFKRAWNSGRASKATPGGAAQIRIRLTSIMISTGVVPRQKSPDAVRGCGSLCMCGRVSNAQSISASELTRGSENIHAVMECVPSGSVEAVVRKLRPILPAEEKKRDQGGDPVGKNKYCAYSKCSENGEQILGVFFSIWWTLILGVLVMPIRGLPSPSPCAPNPCLARCVRQNKALDVRSHACCCTHTRIHTRYFTMERQGVFGARDGCGRYA